MLEKPKTSLWQRDQTNGYHQHGVVKELYLNCLKFKKSSFQCCLCKLNTASGRCSIGLKFIDRGTWSVGRSSLIGRHGQRAEEGHGQWAVEGHGQWAVEGYGQWVEV